MKKQTKEEITNLYQNAGSILTVKNAPKLTGYYSIIEIFENQLDGIKSTMLAKALFNPSDSGLDIHAVVTVQFQPLFNKGSIGPKDLDRDNLDDYIIHITKVYRSYTCNKSGVKGSNNIDWCVIKKVVHSEQSIVEEQFAEKNENEDVQAFDDVYEEVIDEELIQLDEELTDDDLLADYAGQDELWQLCYDQQQKANSINN
jgi:hypothetical protein